MMGTPKPAIFIYVLSLVLVGVGALILIFHVQLIKMGIDKQKVLSNGSEAYETWRHVPVALLVDVYVFNLTNADEVAAGSSEIVVQEIGPYVFQDNRDKIIYDEDGETITYLPQSLFEFLPERTADHLSLSDAITSVNLPLVIAASMAKEFSNKPIVVNAIKAAIGKAPPLETRTVDEIVFAGYVSPIFEKLRSLKPIMQLMGIDKEIPEKMAILFDKNMTDKEGNWTIGTGRSDSRGFTSLTLWNSETTIGLWSPNSTCDVPRGTDGLQFHSDITEDEKLDVFVGDFCRSFRFSYDSDDKVLGVSAKKFTMESIFDSTAQEDKCYCTGALDCDKDGLSDVSGCVYGAPIFVSKPHFLGAPYYQANITGLRPDVRLHEAWVKVEPWLGATLMAGIKLQVNIALSNQTSLRAPFAPNILPLLWLNSYNDFSDKEVQKLNSLLFNKIALLRGVAAAFIVTSFALTAGLLILIRRQSGHWSLLTQCGSNPTD